jgi:hypothetical protein
MPAPKKSRATARKPRPRKMREKLDARFDWLLSLSAARLERLVLADLARVRETHAELHRLLEGLDYDTAADPDRLGKVLEPIRAQLFSPLTTGIHLPKPAGERRPPLRVPYASVLIRGDASSQDLKRLGARVRARSCSTVTAYVALDKIQQLEQTVAVEAIELARPLVPTLDQTLPYAGINALQAGPPPHTGAGVIVGIYDSVLDVYHPDFRTAGGQSRVRFLWDQSLSTVDSESAPPTAPALPGFTPAGGFSYGVEYSKANIDAELAHPAADPPYGIVRHGGAVAAHGTHVTGIAAGNGLAGNVPPRPGAAPGADIIFVASAAAQGSALIADSAALADGISYIFARANALGQPCVANVSITDNQGPHDGTTLGEGFIDGLLTVPGRALTIAAGNTTNTGAHASGVIAQGDTTNVRLGYAAPTPQQPHRSDSVEIWYAGQDRFTVTVTPQGGPAIGPLAAGGGSLTQSLPGNVQVTVASTLNDARNGDNLISIITTVPAGQSIEGLWAFDLTATTAVNGRFEAWVDVGNTGLSAFQEPYLDEMRLTLGVPATCRRAITVGNHLRTSPPPPKVASDSGLGPTRDGRLKPDVVTVGTDVNAPRSRNMALASPGPFYVSMSGTSMASALVAGTLALVYECRGASLSWSDLLQVLQDNASAMVPLGLPAVPNNSYGYGWMQAATLCSAPVGTVDVWIRDDAADTGIEPSGAAVIWQCPDIHVLDTQGSPVPNPTYNPTARFNNIIRVTARNRGSGIARNVEVFLYWADPGTNIPFPSEWRSAGIYVGASPDFATPGNRIVIPQIPAGGSADVEFAWAPPAPGSGVAGDDHFCLLARLEHPVDPSHVAAGGFPVIAARNNLGLRNVHVQPNATGGDAETAFTVIGTGDADVLVVNSVLPAGQVRFDLPVRALPWRDARLIERLGRPRQPFGRKSEGDPVDRLELTLKGDEVEERTGVVGAATLELHGGLASITLGGDRLVIPCVHVVEGARMPVRVRVNEIRTRGEQRFVHVAQLAGGRRLGGVTLELRKGLKHPRGGGKPSAARG